MGYYVDLKKISIDKYKEVIKSADLIPSRMVLKENTGDNLDKLKKHNFQNLDELQKGMKDKSKLHEFSKQFGIPPRFLEVLRAEINGYLPKPNRIKDFPGIKKDVAYKLETIGIKNTLQLYDEILTDQNRKKLSKKTGIKADEIDKIAKLTDLSRIQWVNHTFAYVLLEAGYETAKDVAEADYIEMCEKIKKLNKERSLYKGSIGEHDMKLTVEAARRLDFEIEF